SQSLAYLSPSFGARWSSPSRRTRHHRKLRNVGATVDANPDMNESDVHERVIPLLRAFTVFNVAQVEGLSVELSAWRHQCGSPTHVPRNSSPYLEQRSGTGADERFISPARTRFICRHGSGSHNGIVITLRH